MSAVYPSALENIWNGNIDISTNTLKACLMASTYTYSAAHDTLSDVTAHVVSTTTLTGVTLDTSDKGVLKADNIVWASPGIGDAVGSVIVYADDGVGGERLLAYFDRRTDGRAISFTTAGGAVTHSLRGGRLMRI